MHLRPLHSLSRILLVTCAVGLGTTALFAQDTNTSQPPAQPTQAQSSSSAPAAAPAAPAPASTAPQAPYASRIDIFAGYSYLAPHGSVTIPGGTSVGINGPVTYSSIDYGAIGSGTYYFNRYVGGQVEFSDHPDGNNDGAAVASGGIVFRYPTEDITPFVHFEAGAVRLGGPFKEPYTWGPSLTAGGGLDYGISGFLNNHLAIRVFQADYQYYHVNFGPQNPYPTGGRANLNVVRLSAGIVYRMGNITPPPPVTYQCAASPASVYPGDPVTITGTATNLNPKKNPTYSWTGNNGVKVTGDSNTGNVDTNGLNPGSYTVTGHVSQGQKAGMFADCTANFEVKQFEPPTISCSANPSTVKPGDSATITAQGVSPQNRPLTYTYSTSAGQINGSNNSATLNTSGAPAGPITVTCNVSDDKGQTASTTTTVNVEQPPPPPQPKTQTLCSINFDRDKRRPARVDNEAKACLDDVANNLQQQSDATAVVVGDSATNERMGPKLAAQRAVNAKDYLVKEKGIDASRVQVRTGTEAGKQVQNYLVPAGANFDNDVQGTTQVNEDSVRPQARTGRGHARRRHAKKAPAAQQ
ncbi:MAG TPA: OmpA family protein [Acidobacteriaceae bacterium]|jgi:outer membrane protein OmpA-like peptidoglycan-associated protein